MPWATKPGSALKCVWGLVVRTHTNHHSNNDGSNHDARTTMPDDDKKRLSHDGSNHDATLGDLRGTSHLLRRDLKHLEHSFVNEAIGCQLPQASDSSVQISIVFVSMPQKTLHFRHINIRPPSLMCFDGLAHCHGPLKASGFFLGGRAPRVPHTEIKTLGERPLRAPTTCASLS